MNATNHIAALLKEHMGLDMTAVGSALIERGTRERMNALGLQDLFAYLSVLQTDASEVQELIELVVVPETWFFRDREAILAAARLAREQVMRVPGSCVRILSLPCSTGEEPYSIAMALLDAGVPAAQFRIDAFDISRSSLAFAGLAVYGRNSFRGKLIDFRDRHFIAGDGVSSLSEAVRRQVTFRFGNMIAPDFLRNESPYDFVFCRNVLIYFDRDLQQQAVQVLDRLLAPQGCVFVGPAEAGIMLRPHIESIGIPLAFGFRRRAAAVNTKAAPASASPVAVPAEIQSFAPRLRTAAREKKQRASALPMASAKTTAILMERATRCADQGDFSEAAAWCLQYQQAAGPDAAGYYLMGLICDATQDAAGAMQFYRKAIYLQPDHREALMHLAALIAAQGDPAGAERMQQRAQRAWEKSHV